MTSKTTNETDETFKHDLKIAVVACLRDVAAQNGVSCSVALDLCDAALGTWPCAELQTARAQLVELIRASQQRIIKREPVSWWRRLLSAGDVERPIGTPIGEPPRGGSRIFRPGIDNEQPKKTQFYGVRKYYDVPAPTTANPFRLPGTQTKKALGRE